MTIWSVGGWRRWDSRRPLLHPRRRRRDPGSGRGQGGDHRGRGNPRRCRGHCRPVGRARRGREVDSWDSLCDHLLVLDRSIDGDAEDQIVGTYRILRHEVAMAHGGFYSGSEFRVGDLVARHKDKRFMELGRSCVLPQYRTKRTVELLWQGCWAYALQHRIDAMFGCGSFPGTQPEEHALALSFLQHNAVARGEWAVDALPHLYREMDLMPSEAVNARRALLAMPPLIKGYLRLGGVIGQGAVIDHTFGTTDVCVMVKRETIAERYLKHYERQKSGDTEAL